MIDNNELKTIDWNAAYYGSPSGVCRSRQAGTILDVSMTVLAGDYLDSGKDVFLIADRLSAPRNAVGVSPIEDARKTLRLGEECAIGFSGAVPLHSAVLCKLLGVKQPPQEYDLLSALAQDDAGFGIPFDDVVDSLNAIVPYVVAALAPPEGLSMIILLAGRMAGGLPVLAKCSEATDWQLRPSTCGYVATPVEEADRRAALQSIINDSEASRIEVMKAAIGFCADHCRNVNRHYTLRRLSNGFRMEEGVV